MPNPHKVAAEALSELVQVQIPYKDWEQRCAGGFYADKGIVPETDTHWGRAIVLLQSIAK